MDERVEVDTTKHCALAIQFGCSTENRWERGQAEEHMIWTRDKGINRDQTTSGGYLDMNTRGGSN